MSAAFAAVVVLASCGSSSSSSSSAESAGAKDNGVASKSPAQIVAAAQSALRSASGFVAAGVLTQGGQAVRLEIVDGGASKLQVQFSEKGRAAEIIALPGAGYVRANEAFWSAQVGAKAASLANRWIELPASAGQQLTSSFGQFAPSTLSRCLGENLGMLSRDGSTTVDGKPAVVVRQAANVPGSNPGTLAVQTDGPAYPLRVTSTGPTRPGGKVDVCNDGKGGDTEGSLTFTDFGHAPAITAPQHPIKPSGAPTSSV
jgi:hypothetical protein